MAQSAADMTSIKYAPNSAGLRKRRPSAIETPCEYVGFEIPDVFVVGYGLDYNNYYRNLPDIATLKKEAL